MSSRHDRLLPEDIWQNFGPPVGPGLPPALRGSSVFLATSPPYLFVRDAGFGVGIARGLRLVLEC